MSEIIDSVIKSALELGASELTMKQLEILNIPEPKPMTANQIKRLRKRLKLSQALFATVLGISKGAYLAWEHGDTKPKGTALRCLNKLQSTGLLSSIV